MTEVACLPHLQARLQNYLLLGFLSSALPASRLPLRACAAAGELSSDSPELRRSPSRVASPSFRMIASACSNSCSELFRSDAPVLWLLFWRPSLQRAPPVRRSGCDAWLSGVCPNGRAGHQQAACVAKLAALLLALGSLLPAGILYVIEAAGRRRFLQQRPRDITVRPTLELHPALQGAI